MGLFNRLTRNKEDIPENLNIKTTSDDSPTQYENTSIIDSTAEEQAEYTLNRRRKIWSIIAVIICSIFSASYLYFFFIGLVVTLFSVKYLLYGIIGIVVSGALLIINIILICRFASVIKSQPMDS